MEWWWVDTKSQSTRCACNSEASCSSTDSSAPCASQCKIVKRSMPRSFNKAQRSTQESSSVPDSSVAKGRIAPTSFPTNPCTNSARTLLSARFDSPTATWTGSGSTKNGAATVGGTEKPDGVVRPVAANLQHRASRRQTGYDFVKYSFLLRFVVTGTSLDELRHPRSVISVRHDSDAVVHDLRSAAVGKRYDAPSPADFGNLISVATANRHLDPSLFRQAERRGVLNRRRVDLTA